MQELIRELEQTALKTEFMGVISILSETEPIFNKAFGYQDIKNKVPNTTDTIFGIASGTKIFTALGIGVLIDQGVLALETTVGEIDTKYVQFVDGQATIQQLLAHTSGIYDYYDEEIVKDFDHFSVEIPWSKLETPSDYWPLFEGQSPKFSPGERFSYSNGGYVFLGILIEKLSGMLYREFIQEHVLRPAQMIHSGFYALNDLPPNTANGYFENRQTTNIYQLPLRGGGDGGMYTTTDDLRAFWQHVLACDILSPDLTTAYLRTQHAFNAKYGYGCGVYKQLDDSIFYIVGGDAGVGFDSRYLVPQKWTINILSNVTDGEGGIRDVIRSHLF